MSEIVQSIDVWLFHFFNSWLANPLFDKLMPFITEVKHWLLVYVFLLVMLFWKGGRAGRLCGAALLLGVVLSDQLNSHFLKEIFARLRPCFTLDSVRLLVDCGPGKSFPSSHAVNNFVMAMILSHFYGSYRWLLFTIAALMAFSRVYIGVHYPFDVIGGAAIGILLGWLILVGIRPIEKKLGLAGISDQDRQSN